MRMAIRGKCNICMACLQLQHPCLMNAAYLLPLAKGQPRKPLHSVRSQQQVCRIRRGLTSRASPEDNCQKLAAVKRMNAIPNFHPRGRSDDGTSHILLI